MAAIIGAKTSFWPFLIKFDNKSRNSAFVIKNTAIKAI